ncbi:MAG: methyltransferase domain-containing protein [Acidobacteriota bacterium]
MAYKFDPHKAYRLEDPARYALIQPERTLRALGLKRGDIFADVGAGAGFFAFPGARLVGPEGKVFALDVEKEMLEYLGSKNPPAWVNMVLCQDGELPIPDNEADLTLSSLVLHETDKPVEFIREMGRITKPRKPVVLIDWAKKEEPDGPPLPHRLHHHEAEDLVMQAGLALRTVEFISPSHYMLSCWKR